MRVFGKGCQLILEAGTSLHVCKMEGPKKFAEFFTFLVVLFCLASENVCEGIIYFIILLSVLLLGKIMFDVEPSVRQRLGLVKHVTA